MAAGNVIKFRNRPNPPGSNPEAITKRLSTMRRLLVYFLCLLCLSLCGMNIMLQRSLHHLSLQVQAMQHVDGPAIGQRMPRLYGSTEDGSQKIVTLGQSGRYTLIFVFSPTCRFCTATLPAWTSLKGTLPSNADLVWVDVSNTATTSYFSAHNIAEPNQMLRLGAESRDIYSLHVTPITIVVNPDASVNSVLLGPLDSSGVEQVRKALAG
jgi:hypothetical protein